MCMTIVVYVHIHTYPRERANCIYHSPPTCCVYTPVFFLWLKRRRIESALGARYKTVTWPWRSTQRNGNRLPKSMKHA